MGDRQQVERSSSVDPIVWPRVGQGQRKVPQIVELTGHLVLESLGCEMSSFEASLCQESQDFLPVTRKPP
ncbi:hypothetical protein QQF64_008268 [Cirrhinus molitorella]|uniref:Uncharacterized protein n=1 Tax=Cirrhinus molitorella TaxID=172907 RepID=A0ABR3M862_9TELE